MFKLSSPIGILLIPVLLASPVISASANLQFSDVHSWKSLDFLFPSEAERNAAIESKAFIPGGLMPLDVDVDSKGDDRFGSRVFVSVPRFQEGVPVTLGYVTDKKNSDGNPLIAPYPNWRMQTPGGDCMGITSVYRMAIDSCHRLWVLDTGKLSSVQTCPPKILVYSLQTNILLKRYVFPPSEFRNASIFATPVVDIRDSCDDAYVYLADPNAFSLTVFDYRNSRSWRIENDLFKPNLDLATFEINGESFTMTDGIFGMALGPIDTNGDRMLYFHSLASRTEGYVPTSVIRNRATFAYDAKASPESFRSFPNPRSSQSAAEAMDRNGVLFYGLLSDIAIGCWNSRNFPQFGGQNIEIVATNRETLQFPSGMKVINSKPGNREELWLMTAPIQKVINGSLKPNETNFRIQAAYIDELVRGTKCESSANLRNHQHHHHGHFHHHHHHHNPNN